MEIDGDEWRCMNGGESMELHGWMNARINT